MTKRERRKLYKKLFKKFWPIVWKSGLKAGEIWLEKEMEKLNGKL